MREVPRYSVDLGGGFKFGEDFQVDQYFSKGLKPPTKYNQVYVDACSCFNLTSRMMCCHL